MNDLTFQVDFDVVGDFNVEIDRDKGNWWRKTDTEINCPISTVVFVPNPVKTKLLFKAIEGYSFSDWEDFVDQLSCTIELMFYWACWNDKLAFSMNFNLNFLSQNSFTVENFGILH